MVCQTFELCIIAYTYKKQRNQRSEYNRTGVSGLYTMACLGADHLRDDLGNHCRHSMCACKMLLRKVCTCYNEQFNKYSQP